MRTAGREAWSFPEPCPVGQEPNLSHANLHRTLLSAWGATLLPDLALTSPLGSKVMK